ncbi:uncharacterized protein BDR25DRAFT_271004 [Lindgomyces ingoldianus]|uniref:Uncharacterized protein n=1 Tax=Lindgomyces ingoldianus TaxID=673940 RepID=A0ACB6QDS6_9PLEO|nr:uncharacterized protein BDR25DRAFT_271004 [Lindgomyces ingoldianus]KAF2465108.1 hypothetical protein BDR25DRAFT_271004 [Lindgomyces ingoldianus]
MVLRSVRAHIYTIQIPCSYRSFHSRLAKFVTINAKGFPTEREVSIRVGDDHEAYVLVPTDVGTAIKAGCALQQGFSHNTDSEHLLFHHDTRRFTCTSAPYPQLSIDHDLPRQSNSKTSPATLYLFGATHTIALDKTPDAEFAKESQETWREMKPVLDNLKDM